ncbi:MAG: ABC transporter substrate binding protein [Planctomycetota bacterium]
MLIRHMLVMLAAACFVGNVGCKKEAERPPESAPREQALVQEEDSGNVLLVHSYHREYEWVAGISRGVQRALENTDVELETYYMDTKRRTEAAWKQESGQSALKTVETWQPDVVIAVDDNAQQYFARHLIGKNKPKVVFCGVNAEAADYGYPAANATGILERPHYRETLALLSKIKPDVRRIAVITDNSPTSAGALKYMRAQEIALDVVAWETPGTFKEWQQQIQAAQDRADAIVTYMYHTVAQEDTKQSMTPSEVMAWSVANSRIPLVGMFSFAVDDGMLCGAVESAVEHGVEAGRITQQILAGVPPSEIPIVTATQGQTMLNLDTARKLGIVVPPSVIESVDIVIGEARAP